ncbi:RING-type domain-containing protein [Mycena chlorophos]|uniref:RING-type E3 ubiquitin transferase n=1 Tax=Mycena chlorophos TaxID=658473 RepID=A0A8H6W9X2_MYCCL|nr:RING-type domain-containing protein [Mycena chlorophos]
MDQPRDEEDGPPIPARNPIPHFLFISFLLFLLTNHNGDEFLARHQYMDSLRTISYQLSNFTAWLNGTIETNFTLVRDCIAPLPELTNCSLIMTSPLRRYCATLGCRADLLAHLRHTTQTAQGPTTETRASTTSPPSTHRRDGLIWLSNTRKDLNTTLASEKLGTWNWTASDKIALSLGERPPPPSNVSEKVTLVHGKLELTDARTSEDLRLEFEGIHFVVNGSMFAMARPSGQNIDLRYLPSIVPEAYRNETAKIVEPELASRIEKLKQLIDAGVIAQDLSSGEMSRTSCSFLLYMAQDPVPVSAHLLSQLEDEIQHPTGIWTVRAPPMSLDGLLMSKECGILYEFRRTEGLGLQTLFRKLTTYAGVAGVIYLIMLVLLSRQMKESRTPAGISRLSFWTFLVQSTVDSLSFAGHTVFALVADGKPSLSLIAPAFLVCVLFANEAQFAALIYQFQAPESTRTTPPAPPSPTVDSPTTDAGSPAANTANTAPDGTNATPLPAPAVQPRDQPSFTAFFIHHLRSDPQLRLWLMLFISLSLIVHTILSATLSIIFVAASYSMFWLPQIVRSVQRGRGSGLSSEYLLGTTICRLSLALYFLLCPKNVLDIDPRPWSRYLALFVCLQAIVVILQDTRLGPTFFLPRRYAVVKAYDYHPIMPLPDDDPESANQSLGDCAICMDAIYVDPSRRRKRSLDDKSAGRSAAALLNGVQIGANARQNYSVAPCHHIFHTECLERWLAIKNICPSCRRALPAL